MSRKKTKVIENVPITNYAAEGNSLAHLDDGKVLFVRQAIPGDVVDVRVTKNKKNWAEGVILNLKMPSPMRVDSFCPHFGTCGGCKWQMLPYSQQLVYKQQQVKDQLKRIGNLQIPPLETIIGSPRDRYYRNKLEFTFSAQRYLTREEITAAKGQDIPDEQVLGFHAPGMFDKIVPIHSCYLQPEPTNRILAVVRDYTMKNNLSYYHFRRQKGWLRNLIIRVARTSEVLVNLVISYEDEPSRKALLDHLVRNIPEITSLYYTINQKKNDSLHDLQPEKYYGKSHIEETLEDFRFLISPKSFFQTNTFQAEILYQQVRELACFQGSETVYDLYCGTGSIGIFCARHAKKIIGIELIPEAIEDARQNAERNQLDNCRFYCGDVERLCTEDFFREHGRPDLIITDPPRAGMTERLVRQLKTMAPSKIIYVSCNPATQARDLTWLQDHYVIRKLQPIDMFPHTHHIENVALLEKRPVEYSQTH